MIPFQISAGPTDYTEIILGVSAVIFVALGWGIKRSRRAATDETEYGNWYIYLPDGNVFEGILSGAERYVKRKKDSPTLKDFLEHKATDAERAEVEKLMEMRFYAQTSSPHNTLVISPSDVVKESVTTATEWHWLPFPHYETYHRFFGDWGSEDLGIVNGWRSLLVFARRKPEEKAVLPILPNPDLLAKVALVLTAAATSREEVAAARASEDHWKEGFGEMSRKNADLAADNTSSTGILATKGIDATGIPDLSQRSASLMEVVGVVLAGVMIGLTVFPQLLQRGQILAQGDYMLDAFLGFGIGILFLKWRKML
jgi:hypothetical protein